MISAKKFRNTYIGKAIDVDGVAGVQCVDLFKKCCYLAGKKAFSLGGSGYADEIVHRFTALGLDDYFTKVSLADAQYGDWCVWDKGSKEAPDSHVAMFEKKDGSSRAIFLGQNQGGVSKATEISISTSGIIGVLRLKAWATTSKCPFKSSGTVKALYDKIRVRTSPSTSKGNTGSYYNTGMTLNYSSIVEGDGWYWAKYTSYDGETHYCALCKTDGSSKYWKQA